MNTHLDELFETTNDAPSELLVINGLHLRVNPTDISVMENKTPETVGMIRSSKTYTYASKFVKGKILITIAFDVNNSTDLDNMIVLSTYLDLYPFAFVKSETLEAMAHHSYSDIDGYQIYGIHAYSVNTTSGLQGVYIFSIELEYFNYVPLARKLSFFNLEKNKEVLMHPQSGEIEERDKNFGVRSADPGGSELFQGFFAAEIAKRRDAVSTFLNDKGPSYVGIRVPNFFRDDGTIEVDDQDEFIKRVGYSQFKNPESILTASPDTDPVEKFDVITQWTSLVNPVNNSKDLNLKNTLLQAITVTKRNYIASKSMSAYPYPILQYMGKGQADISIGMISSTNTDDPETIQAAQLIKTCLTQLSTNSQRWKQLAPYNVLKLETLITTICPLFGVLPIGERSGLSSTTQGQEHYELYLVEADNREILERAKFTSSGAKAGVDLDYIIQVMLRVLDYISNTPEPIEIPAQSNNTYRVAPPRGRTQADLDKLQELEKKYNLPTGLLYGIMMTESGGRTEAISRRADGTPVAYGPFQFIPSTARQYGFDVTDFNQPNYFNVCADAAARYMQTALRTNQDIRLAIASYNTGQGNVNKHGLRVLSPTYAHGETFKHNQRVFAFQAQAVGTDTAQNLNQLANNTEAFKSEQEALKEFTMPYGEELKRSLQAYIPDSARPRLNLGNGWYSFKYFVEHSNIFKANLATEPRFKNVLQQAHVALTKLALNGNKLAQAALQRTSEELGDVIGQLEDKFRDEGVPDLNFVENVSASILEKFNVKDVREIPPFFFLAHQSYFAFKDVSALFDIVANLANDTTTADVVEKEKKYLLERIDKQESREDLIKQGASLQEVNTVYDNIPLTGNFNQGFPKKKELQEIVDTIQGDVFNHPSDPSQKLNPFDPKDIINQQKTAVTSYFKHGLNIAFPVIKVYLVEGDESSVGELFEAQSHLYYELDGIIELSLSQNNDENPVDVLAMTIANPGSVYTDRHVLLDKYKAQKQFQFLGTEAENKFLINAKVVRPGMRLHVRAGYGNNSNELETVFNGIITEVGGEHTLSVLAEGFGRELVLYRHGDDPTNNSFFLNANTKAIMSNALSTGEIEHFGITRLLKERDPEAKRLFTLGTDGIFGWLRSSEKYTNLYFDAVQSTDDNYKAWFFNTEGLFDIFNRRDIWNKYPIYKRTPWDMLKEMEFRHPGTLSKPAIYQDRMTYFFGFKEQLYVHKGVHGSVPDGKSLGQAAAAVFGSYFDSYDGGELYKKFRSHRFKPICDLHIASSEHNILCNKIKATDEFYTVLNVEYDKDLTDPGEEDFFELKVDDNLKPSAHRRGELSMPGISDKFTALRYGAVGLRRELEKMYDGSLVLIGNARIKPGDFIALNDQFRNMHGLIKVRACEHMWSLEDGYVTVVTPGLYVDTNIVEYKTSKIFPLLYGACYTLSELNSEHSKVDYVSSTSFVDKHIFIANAEKVYTNPESGWENKVSTWVPTLISAPLSYKLIKTATNFVGPLRTSLTANVIQHTPEFLMRGFSVVKSTSVTALSIAKDIAVGVSRNAYISKGLSVAGKGMFAVSRVVGLVSPVGLAVSLIAYNVYAAVEFSLNARQPVRIYPLTQNGIQYLAGIYGYKENSLWTSIKENVENTIKDAEFLLTSINAARNANIE